MAGSCYKLPDAVLAAGVEAGPAGGGDLSHWGRDVVLTTAYEKEEKTFKFGHRITSIEN